MPIRTAVIAAVCLAVVLGGWLAFAPSATTCCKPELLRTELRDRFDVRFPGRGPTDYPGHTVDDVAKGYAMILKAELIASEAAEPGRFSEMGRHAADFLVKHSDERRDGFPGWGVPIAWDPYGDGSTNAAHTKYTISTAIVADALLDWIDRDDAAPRDDVIGLVEKALAPYTDPGNLSPSGLLPYSLEPVDRPYDTFNPAGYLAGVLQRFSHLTKDTDLAGRLRDTADKTVLAHLEHVRKTEAGGWYWPYSISENVPNDLAHAGYVVHGLRLYAEHGGRLAGKLDLDAIDAHLADFVALDKDGRPNGLVAWPTFRADANTPARSYGLGMGLYLVCRRPSTALQDKYLAAVPRYRREDGSYAKYPPGSGLSDLAVREYEAYVLLGLAACAGRRGA